MDFQSLMYQSSFLQIERDSALIRTLRLAANSEQQGKHRLHDARCLKFNMRMAENGSYQEAYALGHKVPSYTC
jgi:hypothetical protein